MTEEQVYAILKKRINSNGVSQEKIDKAVESYLERNPIMLEQIDKLKEDIYNQIEKNTFE